MNTNTLTDFLQQAQCQFRIYDLGRKVTKISNSAFQKIAENRHFGNHRINRAFSQKTGGFLLVFYLILCRFFDILAVYKQKRKNLHYENKHFIKITI